MGKELLLKALCALEERGKASLMTIEETSDSPDGVKFL